MTATTVDATAPEPTPAAADRARPRVAASRDRSPRSASRSSSPALLGAQSLDRGRRRRGHRQPAGRREGLRRRPVRPERQARARAVHRRRVRSRSARASGSSPGAGSPSPRRRVRGLRGDRVRWPRSAIRPCRPPPQALVAGVAAIAGIRTLSWLLGRAPTPAVASAAPGALGMPDWSRRGFLIRSRLGRRRRRSSPASSAGACSRAPRAAPSTGGTHRSRRRPRRDAARRAVSSQDRRDHAARRPERRLLPDRHRPDRARASTSPRGASRSRAWSTARPTLTYAELVELPIDRAVRDDRLRLATRSAATSSATPSGPASGSATSSRSPASRPSATQLVGRSVDGWTAGHADELGHGPGSRADDRRRDERRAAAARPRLPGPPDRARACSATCRRRSGCRSSS